jgi:cytosine/adenosine deaminase-related metal-dependent hydrolase
MILGADWVLPVDGAPIAGGAVRVEGGEIAEVSAGLEPDQRFDGCAILPGLVNAHSHLEYAGMSGFGDGRPFDGWIADHIRRRDGLGRDDYLAQARAGVAESLAGGVTTIADCCYAGTVADAAAEVGMRAIVYLEAFSRHDVFDVPLERRLDAVEPRPLITVGISPHAPYTVDLEDYRRWVGLARERGMPVATHLLEGNLDENPAAYFRDVLGPDTAVIHAVTADADDIALFAELGVPVVHCPRSNALLGCGIAPVPALREAGVRVALGTDSPASALTLDMWDEMRAAILLARAGAARPDVLTAGNVLRMATCEGAAALGLPNGLGTLRPGAPADLIVVDLNGSPFLPWDDPEAAVVYGGTPERVALAMVAGRIRFRAGGAAADTTLASSVRARMIDA